MAAPESVAAPVMGLNDEALAWEALLALLNDEEQALANGEIDRLPSLNVAKLAQLQDLGERVRARRAALHHAGFSHDPAGMAAWLAGHTNQSADWESIRALEQQAQAVNQRIGVLIQMRLGSTRQALNVLLQASARQGVLYDQTGQTFAPVGGRPLSTV